MPIPDHRRAQGRWSDLPHMLLFSILAVMSGAASYRRIHQFIRTHQQRLNEAFGCHWRRTPAYTSIRHALQAPDPGEIAPRFRAHAAALAESAPVIALDGEALRGSLDRLEGRKAAQVLGAFAGEGQTVPGQILIEDAGKGHEIQAAQRLIETLGLGGRPYTLDALHPQKKPLRP